MTEYDNLHLDVEDGIAIITLDRPPVNALSMALYRDIAAAFGEVNTRVDEIGAVVLTGAGRCFCGGRDLKLAETDPPDVRSKAARASYTSIHHCAVPVIAAINGPAMGAGFMSALGADILYASEAAVLGLPEIDAGLNVSLATMSRGYTNLQARRFAFTGERVSPEVLERIGVISRVLPPDRLMPEAIALAKEIASKNPEGVRRAKLSADDIERMWADYEFAYAAIEHRANHDLLNSPDRIEAGRAFREKRAPKFSGAPAASGS
ncbi:MAG: enoyl-CoA hydratase-related protein [Actinomycetota bacterium]